MNLLKAPHHTGNSKSFGSSVPETGTKTRCIFFIAPTGLFSHIHTHTHTHILILSHTHTLILSLCHTHTHILTPSHIPSHMLIPMDLIGMRYLDLDESERGE